MKKQLSTLLLVIMSLMMIIPSDLSAQTVRQKASTKKAKAITTLSKTDANKRKNDHARLMSIMPQAKKVGSNSNFQSMRAGGPLLLPLGHFQSPALTAGDGVTIYGSVIFGASWTNDNSPSGMYSFPASANTTLTSLMIGSNFEANGGGVYVDGKYHMVNYMDIFGFIIANYHIYNTETWETIYSADVDATSVATDMTFDPITGNVYGCFFNEDLDGYVFGTMDLETGTTTKIADLPLTMYVVAANSKGEIYGIGNDGVLYSINKSTGETTSIGNTGVSPKYIQSGTFDPKTDKLYWAASLADDTSALYEVNVSTGVATLISPFSDSEEIVGLYIPAPAAEDDAPAAVTDLTATYEKDATIGKIKFTMPDKTFIGGALNGSLSYSITFNGDEKVSGTANAGTSVEKSVTVETGMYTIGVTTSNAVGKSPLAKLSMWIGKDAPVAVQNLKLVKGDVENKLMLSWKAPVKGINDGYFDPTTLNYKVVRYPGKVVVADKIAITSFSEVVNPESLANYWYEVTAFAGSLEGETSASNKIALGNALTVPYLESFDIRENFELFTVIDANNDGKTWNYDATNFAVKCDYSSANEKDEWLISPPVTLGVDHLYKLYFKVKCANSSYPERVKVAFGKDKTVEAMTSELIPPTNIENEDYINMEATIKAPAAGDYYIGIQACSDADMFNLFVDDFEIELSSAIGAPAEVNGLKAVAAVQGKLETTISFITPNKAINGSVLTSLSKVELYRENDLIKIFNTPAVGTELTYTDKEAKQGTNVYTVVASNGAGAGAEAKTSVYAGIDTPAVPINVVLKEVNGKAVLTWEAPSIGEAGGYIDPATLKYYIKRNDNTIVAESISELTFTDEPDLSGGQKFVYYFVYAESIAGIGYGTPSNSLIMGTPYDLPFVESFAGAELSKGPWVLTTIVGDASWTLAESGEYPDVDPQDNDGGLASFVPGSKEGDAKRLSSGKISLKGSVNPALEFYYYFVPGATEKLIVEVAKESGDFEAVRTINLAPSSIAEGWTKVTIPLKDFISAEFIQIGFQGVTVEGGYNLHLDNIKVRNLLDYDIMATAINAPKTIKVGESKDISVTIMNNGLKEAKDYTVELYRNGKMVNSLVGETLTVNATKTYKFTETPTIDFDASVTYYSVVNYAADLDQNNNKTTEAVVAVKLPTYPTITDLVGMSTDNKVVLSWSEPDYTGGVAEPITDDIEEYDAFIIDNVGEWTLVDVDGGKATYGIDNGAGSIIKYDNAGAPMAFQVFNPSAAGIAVADESGVPTAWAPHSGEQMFAAFADEDGQNDDWLISPELPGTAQTISFFAKSVTDIYGLETLEVLFSSTNSDVQSFSRVNDAAIINEVPVEWTKITAQLPAGTKFFAIRCTSTDQFALLIDDITYTPASATPEELSLVGYNVYRDGEKITPVAGVESTYTDATITKDGDYKYKVTTVYDKGESVYSNEVTVNVVLTSIDQVLEGVANAFGIRHAIEIRHAASMDICIYTIDGKLVYKGMGEDLVTVPVADGKYVVKVGNKVVKILVK